VILSGIIQDIEITLKQQTRLIERSKRYNKRIEQDFRKIEDTVNAHFVKVNIYVGDTDRKQNNFRRLQLLKKFQEIQQNEGQIIASTELAMQNAKKIP